MIARRFRDGREGGGGAQAHRGARDPIRRVGSIVVTHGETIVQVHGMGPWTITFVNATDDPRNAEGAAK